MKEQYPLAFLNHACPKCGAENATTLVDQNQRCSENPIYPAMKVKCKNCNSEFEIFWGEVNGKQDYFPGSTEEKEKFKKSFQRYAQSMVRKLE